MKRHSTARTAQVARIMSRRPPRTRSSSGLRRGAMIAKGAIVNKRYRRTFSRDSPGDTEKNSDPASDTVRQTSPHMLAACVIASRANGVGSAKRGSAGPVGRWRGGGAVAMAKATLPVVTGNAFLWRPRRRTRRRVHTAFLRRQFRSHVRSVAFWSQLRGCLVYWQRASPCALGRVPPPADEPPAAGSLSTGGPAAVIVRVARWPRVVPGGRGQGRGSRGTG